MSYTFKRQRAPLIYSDVLNIFDNGEHCIQAVTCDDTPGSVIAAFSRDGGHRWYGHHKSTATSLDEFQARFEDA